MSLSSAYRPPVSARLVLGCKKREDLIASPMLHQASPNALTQPESKNKCPLCEACMLMAAYDRRHAVSVSMAIGSL